MADKKRQKLIKNIQTLFDFDENGILPCLAPGMAGPIGMPMGSLELKFEGNPIGTYLAVTWGQEKEAYIIQKNISRKAKNDEILSAFEYYKKEVDNYRNGIIDSYDGEIADIPIYLQKRLGLVPYF